MVFTLVVAALALSSFIPKASLSSSNSIKGEISKSKTSVLDWDPERDPIFDPKSGLCYWEEIPDYTFPPSELEILQKASSTWNPKNDAIYNPETGFCNWEQLPEFEFLPSELHSVRKVIKPSPKSNRIISIELPEDSPASSSAGFDLKSPSEDGYTDSPFESPMKSLGSVDFEYPLESPIEDIFACESSKTSPEEALSLDAQPSESCSSASNLKYVPQKCVNFERMWDFHFGHPENEFGPVGWISRIGFFDNLIEEFNFSTRNVVYTLTPYKYYSKTNLRNQLVLSSYLEFYTTKSNMFRVLFSLSPKIDFQLIRSIICITFTFDADQKVSVKIYINPLKEMKMKKPAYAQLFEIYPFIDYYKPY